MPPKREKAKRTYDDKMKTQTKTTTTRCRFITPGPQYKLKTLVGHKNHCVSKYRNPAYTIGLYSDISFVKEGPGPRYMIKEPKRGGYTFGHAVRQRVVDPGPGFYKLPGTLGGPFFSIKWKPKERKICETPPPYYVKSVSDAPAFSMGIRLPAAKPIPLAGPYSYNIDVVKPKAPRYTIAGVRPLREITKSPGPIYALPPSKPIRAYSFGVKHSECAPPFITDCDKQC